MKRKLAIFIIMAGVFAVCGNLICESGEIGSCRDCAMINMNYVCDNFTGALTQYDPDCVNESGCYGPDPLYIYNEGRGKNCFPGKCSLGKCNYTCFSQEDCSGFCIDSVCYATCENCTSDSLVKIRPVKSTIYLGKPSYVIFAVLSSVYSQVNVTAYGPCDLSYEKEVELENSRGFVIVKITNCKFTGVSSIVLNTSSAKGVIHFLSYPTRLYEFGEVESTAGMAVYASKIGSRPVKVSAWVS